MPSSTRPRRSQGAVLAGVAAALADSNGLSRTNVRLLFAATGLYGVGAVVYLMAWVLLPRRARLAP